MIPLIEQVKKDRLFARKNHQPDKLNVLTTLLGELETNAKRSGDKITNETVIAMCKKIINNNEDTLKKVTDIDKVSLLKAENKMLDKYIPTQMTKSELITIIESLDTKDIGSIMSHLAANYAGLYNKGMAASIARGKK